MAKGSKKKGFCPQCRQPMKLRNRYCEACGSANPLFPQPVRRRPAVKSARVGYAPVMNLRPTVPARDPKWSAILADPDPNGRERLFRTHFAEFTDGGGAA